MSKKKQPARRCMICQREVAFLRRNGIIVVSLLYASDFIKQAISLILEEHKTKIPQPVYRRLHFLRKLTDDACICEICTKMLYFQFVQSRRRQQAKLRLDVRDAAPQEHLDRLREGEPPLTPAEEREFRNLIKSLRSGDGPAVDEV